MYATAAAGSAATASKLANFLDSVKDKTGNFKQAIIDKVHKIINQLKGGKLEASDSVVEGAIGFAPGYAQGIANRGLRKSFRKAMHSVGAKVKFVNEGNSYFNPRTMTAVINKMTATPGTLLDEFTHAFNRMHGKGRYLSDELAEVHKALANRVKVLGSTDRLGLADNTLYHQLELLNFMNSGVELPGFIRVIPQSEISRFLSSIELN